MVWRHVDNLYYFTKNGHLHGRVWRYILGLLLLTVSIAAFIKQKASLVFFYFSYLIPLGLVINHAGCKNGFFLCQDARL